jgi:hypothetical protein
MSISTFAELKAAVYNWLLRSNSDPTITDARVSEYIALCEAEMSRKIKVREIETNTTISSTAGTQTIALPSNFRNAIQLEFASAPKALTYVSDTILSETYGGASSGRPKMYSISGSNIKFGPVPDAVYDFVLTYYRAVPPLSDSQTTNAILTKYPDLYLYGSLKHAALQVVDEKRIGMFGNYFEQIVMDVNKEGMNEQTKGGARMVAKNPIG